jgi:hypothetical protein
LTVAAVQPVTTLHDVLGNAERHPDAGSAGQAGA